MRLHFCKTYILKYILVYVYVKENTMQVNLFYLLNYFNILITNSQLKIYLSYTG